MSLLTVTNLSKKYVRAGKDFFAVNGADLEIRIGEIVLIIGESGSGKSTLLNSAFGFIKPETGSAEFNGIELTKLGDKELSRFRNKYIGFIPQGHSILANLTVTENIALPFWLYNKKKTNIDARMQELIQLTGISHLAAQYPRELSGGELRRVAVARSLINEPVLIAADEPTSNLDEETGENILKLFAELPKKGISLLIVTHNRNNLKYADRAYEMKSGKLSVLRLL